MELSEKTSWRMLSSFSVRWYFHVMREVLIKYKIWLIFLIALLAPSVGFLLKMVTWPADIYLYSGQSNIFEFFIFLLSAALFSMIIGLTHKALLTGREWDGYINALPVPSSQRMASDFITLTLANSLFLGAICYAYFNHLIMGDWHFLEVSLRVVFLVLMMYSTQLAIIYKRNFNLVFPILLGLMAAPLALFFSMPMEMLIMATASYLLWCGLFSLYLEPEKTNQSISLSHFVSLNGCSQRRILALLNIKIILSDIRVFVAGVFPLIILSSASLIFILDASLFPAMGMHLLSLVLFLNMFFLSNIFKPMYNQWGKYRHYISSLPLSRLKFLTSIFIPGLFFGVLINFFLIGVFDVVFFRKNVLFESVVQCFISWFYLFCCFNIQIKLKRYGALVSFLGLVPFYCLAKCLTWG